MPGYIICLINDPLEKYRGHEQGRSLIHGRHFLECQVEGLCPFCRLCHWYTLAGFSQDFVWDFVWDFVRDYVWGFVWGFVCNFVWDFVRDFVWDFARDYVRQLFLSKTNTILSNKVLKSYQWFLELPDRPWHQ